MSMLQKWGNRAYKRRLDNRTLRVLGPLRPGEVAIESQNLLFMAPYGSPVEGHFVVTSQRIAFKPVLGPPFAFEANLDDVVGIMASNSRPFGANQFIWELGIRGGVIHFSTGPDFAKILRTIFRAHSLGEPLEPSRLVRDALEGRPEAPYVAFRGARPDVIAMLDTFWLDSNAENVRITNVMLERCLEYLPVEPEDTLATPGIKEITVVVAAIPTWTLSDAELPFIPTSALFGWAVAKCEEEWKWTKPRKVHQAAHNAKCLGRLALECDAPVFAFAVDLGYVYGRTGELPKLVSRSEIQ